MTMLLRHKPTGDVYIYTELLATRADMEVFEGILPNAPKAAAVVSTATATKVPPPAKAAAIPEPKQADLDLAAKISPIVKAKAGDTP